MRFSIGFICCLLFFSGCGPDLSQPYLRMCTRVDSDYIRKLIPSTVGELDMFVAETIAEIQSLYDDLMSIHPQDRTFYNTIRVYDNIFMKLWMGKQIPSSLHQLHRDGSFRHHAAVAASQVLQLEEKLYHGGGIERALKEYQIYGSDKKYNKVHVQNYLDLALQEHRKYKRKDDGVDRMLGQFLQNAHRIQGVLTVEEELLVGLSDSYKGSLSWDASGLRQVPLDYRSFFEIMERAEDAQLRKQFFEAFGKRGYPENLDLIQKIVSKRNQHARDIGYDSFVDYSFQSHVVKEVDKVEEFLWKMVDSLQNKEYEMYGQMLLEAPDSVYLTDQEQLYPWDETYLKAYFRKQVLGVDDEKISHYFPLQETLSRLLHLYEQFFSISFELDDRHSWWADDVLLYRVSNERNKELLGYVFFDLFHRDGKHEEQKHITMVPGIRDDCNLPCLSVSAVITDFTGGNKTLLELHDVTSLLHEIGHAVHACFGSTKFTQVSGTQVARDFVELPSQYFELWLDDLDILKRISGHYRTGNSLSDKKARAIIQAQKYVRVSQGLKQSFIALLMIELYKNEDRNPHDVAGELYQKIYPYIQYDPDYYVECSIPHFASYGPAYYSYVWTRNLAEKMFKKVRKKGILERSIGKKFSKYILGPGGSGDYRSMVESFLDEI